MAFTKSVPQNIRGFTERLVRTMQRMLGSCLRLLEQCLRTIVPHLPRLPPTMSQPLRLLNQRNIKGLQIHCCSLVSKLVTIAFSVLYGRTFLGKQVYLPKPLVSRKAPGAGATSPMAMFRLRS